MAVAGNEDEQRRRFRIAYEAADLELEQVWMEYFSIGGMSGMVEVQAYVYGAMSLPQLERDLLAHALNQHLDAMGVNGHRAFYSHEIRNDNGDHSAG
ncbi:hypothetical protein AB0N65_16990 [Paenarthrobacter sp. NPDC089322]|uniref:hypothetical protein n=1 Tax=Paenarthrobacter sp. NPDC089322 TaxID=3155065 RepID=UPI0034416CA0